MPVFDTTAGDVNYGSLPSSSAVRMGASSDSLGVMRGNGTINAQLSGPGVVPGATAADNVLAFYLLTANVFDQPGRGIYINALGSTVSNTNTKTLKIIINPTSAVVGSTVGGSGTTIASGAIATTAGSGGWCLAAGIYKYGVLGSNTQLAIHQAAQFGNTVAALTAPTLLTLPETATILIALTGNAATTATDIVFNLMTIEGFN